VPATDVDKTVKLLQAPLKNHPNAVVSCDSQIGKISVEGIGLRSHTDVGAKLFQTLSKHAINVQMVNTSEIKVSVVVGVDEVDTALSSLKDTFGIVS
jgi:aspartate kinase